MSDPRALIFKTEYHPPLSCEECGREMQYKGVGEYTCVYCGHLMYDDYGIVRNYLESNPGSTMGMVAAATGVSEKEIKIMLREERLQIREDSRSFIACESCGKPILSGRFCESCGKLAAAAERRKREKEAIEEKKQYMQGVSGENRKGDSGKKRFMGTDEK